MPLDPDDTFLPDELRALARAIELRFQRAGYPRRIPPGIPEDAPSSWAEVTFDPDSPALSESVRARLAATLGSTSVVRIYSATERSQCANRDIALAQLKALLAAFFDSEH
jgi:hypothetical protein